MTIYALSSGSGKSGIGVIRISGPDTKKVISKLTKGSFPKPRIATLKKINKIINVRNWFRKIKIHAGGTRRIFGIDA